MGNPHYGRRFAVYLTAASLAFAIPAVSNLPNLSLEHLSSPYLKVVKMMEGGVREGHGSGSYLGNGFVLTAAHIVQDAASITVEGENGKTYTATPVMVDTEVDIGILRIDGAGIQPLKVNCKEPTRGTAITMTGNPLMLEFVTLKGFIAKAAGHVWVYKSAITLDITAAQGASGAGIIDPTGALIGVLVAVVTQSESSLPIALASSPTAFCPLLKKAGVL